MTIERGIGGLAAAWRGLSLDAKVVGAVALANWVLLFGRHTVVQTTHDAPLWELFPGLWAAVWLLACGLVAVAYPLRDHRLGSGFTRRDRIVHLAIIVFAFVIVPTIAMILLRATGKPYTYVHDGAIMIEEAARKLLLGQNPYVADYVGTPLFYWPMMNNPALYHLTYFPFPFLLTVPFVAAFDRIGVFWDERLLYAPAYLATLAIVPFLVPNGPRAFAARCALVAMVALNPQLFPFVAEGKNDFFVLCFLFLGIALLQRERGTLGLLAISVAAASKLHAGVLLPFVLVFLIRSAGARTLGDVARATWRYGWPSAAFLAATFLPFILNDPGAFYDDVVAYNAGGAAWSYPISGMGLSAILLWLGIIEYPQQDFPFWILQAAAALPLGVLAMRALWREPTIARLLGGYALTLLAFLFFARYFHGNYLGFILAVASPIAFLPDSRLTAALAPLAHWWTRSDRRSRILARLRPMRAPVASVLVEVVVPEVVPTGEAGD